MQCSCHSGGKSACRPELFVVGGVCLFEVRGQLRTARVAAPSARVQLVDPLGKAAVRAAPLDLLEHVFHNRLPPLFALLSLFSTTCVGSGSSSTTNKPWLQVEVKVIRLVDGFPCLVRCDARCEHHDREQPEFHRGSRCRKLAPSSLRE